LLLVFNAIYEEKSLTQAGQRLHLTQPATSHSLNRLRSSFNNQLFIRHGYHMEPTPLAVELKKHVQEILKLADKKPTGWEAFDPSQSIRTFSIGIAAEFIGLSVSEYEEQAIDIKLKDMGMKRKIRLISIT
jgi:DNA-binding transcriptional LysR family regulator